LLIKESILLLIKPCTTETVFASETIFTILTINAVLAILAIIRIITMHAVNAFSAPLAFRAKGYSAATGTFS
jgi:hypothetical protein|tara:strand:+ start:783 stop:998 length:216 start_codon:yes stop_codon:yes gene_type:complete